MLWGNMNYNYNQATMGYAEGWDFSWVSYKNRGWNNPNLVGYMESHDEERLMYKNLSYGNASGTYNIKELQTALRRMEMAVAFFFTIPGPKMMWQFGELGYDISINFGGRLSSKPLHWEYYNNAYRNHLFQTYSYLIRLKQEELIFSTSDFIQDVSGPVKKIELHSGNNHVIIIGNFDVTGKSASLTFQGIGTWYEYFSGDSIILTDSNYPIFLEPGVFKLFSNKKLTGFGTFPPTSAKSISKPRNVSVYPNPFTSELNICSPLKIKELILYNIQCERIALINGDKRRIFASELPAGIYFLRINFSDGNSDFFKLVHCCN